MMYDSPSSTMESACWHILSNAFLRPSVPSETSNTMGMVSVENPRYLRFLRRSSSLLVMIGCLTLTILQLSGVGESMPPLTGPMYPVMDITSSSLIGSMAGLVTCAKDCLK